MTPEQAIDFAGRFADWKHQDNSGLVIQYLDGATDLPDDLLVCLYRQCQHDKILDQLSAYDPTLTMAQFIKRMADKPVLIGLAKPSYEVAGFGWLDSVQGEPGARKAAVSFAFFRKYHGQPVIRSMARLALRWWFEISEVDVLFGFQLSSNRLARRFARELGFSIVADVPNFLARAGKLESATLTMLTRQAFAASEPRAPRTVTPIQGPPSAETGNLEAEDAGTKRKRQERATLTLPE